MSPEEIPEKYLEEWKKGMEVAMNVHKTGNKTLCESDNSGVGTSLNKSFIKTRTVNLLFFQVDLLLESHVCCVNQKFTAYSFHQDFNTSIYTLNDFVINDFRLWCTVIHSLDLLCISISIHLSSFSYYINAREQ